MAFWAVNDHLSRNDRVFGMEQKRLFRRKMPVFPETFVAISGAKLPEGREPRRTVSGPRAWAGGDQPAFHNSLHESMFQQPISMNPAQFARLKNTPPVFLEFLENAQRCRQFFVRCRHLHLPLSGRIQVYRAAQSQVYADVRLQVNCAVLVQVNSANVGYSFAFASLRRKLSLAAWVLRRSSIVKWNSSSPP
jgi:hypothetical protein